jgi:site-specific DNA-methyltransferase (adenine-specific)
MKLINDDCILALKSIEDNSVNMCLTDIPYNEVNRKTSGIRVFDKGSVDVFDVNLGDFILELNRVVSGSFYIFCGINQISEIRNIFHETLSLTVRLGVWTKTNPTPVNGSRLWLSGQEFCIFARKPKATFNEHCKKALWEYPSGKSKTHPTEKPIKLFERLIKASSNPGDTIIDPCMGSGTTGVACKNLGRDFIGIEIDKKYFKMAESRINENNT